MDDLEDQIHELILLPGPDIKHQTIRKVKNLASQVNKANQDFLATKILDRAAIFNIITENIRESLEQKPIDNSASYTYGPGVYKANPPNRVAPFPRYAHSIGHSFEAAGRINCDNLGHLDLVRGRSDYEDDWWTTMVSNVLNTNGYRA